jgi:hypothetical protein
MTDSSSVHREVLELLPWYVNGTLPERERTRLDHHLGECLPCNAALRDERRLAGRLRDQDVVPLGPEHGKSALFARIDRGGQPAGRRAATRRRAIGLAGGLVPWIGYGLAAVLGGGIVWFWFAMTPLADPADGAFTTLATPAAAGDPRIDIVFAMPPTAAALESFRTEIGGVLVDGPSEIGRYTFAIEQGTEAGVATLLEALRRDPRLRFAGRSYAAASEVGAAAAAGEAGAGAAAGGETR